MSAPEQIFFAVGLVIVGACFGSFLNVVVYRLPAGLSLSHPPSHCPRCGRPIRKRDNVPILGWWLLGGRCRDCRHPISARYPLVEGLTSAIFLVTGVAHIVGQPPATMLPTTTMLEHYAWLVATAFDLTLLCTLLAAILIAWDGHRAPPKLFVFALGVGIIARLVLPMFAPQLLDATLPFANPTWNGRLQQPLQAALGAVAGLILGSLISGTSRDPSSVTAKLQHPLVAATVLIGLYWGWFAVAILSGGTLLAHRLFTRQRSRLPVPIEVWLFAGAVAYAVLVPVLMGNSSFPSIGASAWFG